MLYKCRNKHINQYKFCSLSFAKNGDFFRNFQLHTLKIIFSALTSEDIGRVQMWRFYLIKYAHNGLYNKPIDLGHPELIFQAKVNKFGTNIGPNRLFSISSGFYNNRKNFFCRMFSHLPTWHIKIHRLSPVYRFFSMTFILFFCFFL